MKDMRGRFVAEIGLAVALSVVLNAVFTMLIPFRMPFGGTFSLSMLPIVLLALVRGPYIGITTGVLVGFTDLIFNPFVISLPQMLLDYPIAYGLVGLAGFFALRPEKEGMKPTLAKMMTFAAIGAVMGAFARLLAHVLSGVIFFAQYAPETQNAWVYSVIYNSTFMGPNMIALAACAAIAFPVVRGVLVSSQQTT